MSHNDWAHDLVQNIATDPSEGTYFLSIALKEKKISSGIIS